MSAKDLLYAFETHDPVLIAKAIGSGVDPNAAIGGKAPLQILIEMYTRTPRFPDCIAAMIDGGALVVDPLLVTLLVDDEKALRKDIAGARARRFDLPCAYTSLSGVSALHVCAEYNSVRCAEALLADGADADDCADIDAEGVGGHTPLFHAVNSNANHCRPAMELLVDAGADIDVAVEALSWGRGFEWETTVFAVNPISYAQCGLFPQFHRRPEDIYSNIDYLHRRRYKSPAAIRNVPNRYLHS